MSSTRCPFFFFCVLFLFPVHPLLKRGGWPTILEQPPKLTKRARKQEILEAKTSYYLRRVTPPESFNYNTTPRRGSLSISEVIN